MRRKLVVGNWKMHGDLASNKALLEGVLAGVKALRTADYGVCVPYPYMAQAQAMLQGNNVAWGAQNLSQHERGAFTGAVAPGMLVDFGCRYVIIGHSERRALFHESNDIAAAKFDTAIKFGLTPIFCVGETLDERESGVTEQVVGRQLEVVLNHVGAQALAKAVIAYEPVWAIGTGKTASPGQAEEVHRFIREWFARRYGPESGAELAILYGGSVTPKNIAELMAQPDINGALVGGASLDVDSFIQLVGY